jgi:hypothetical protein
MCVFLYCLSAIFFFFVSGAEVGALKDKIESLTQALDAERAYRGTLEAEVAQLKRDLALAQNAMASGANPVSGPRGGPPPLPGRRPPGPPTGTLFSMRLRRGKANFVPKVATIKNQMSLYVACFQPGLLWGQLGLLWGHLVGPHLVVHAIVVFFIIDMTFVFSFFLFFHIVCRSFVCLLALAPLLQGRQLVPLLRVLPWGRLDRVWQHNEITNILCELVCEIVM